MLCRSQYARGQSRVVVACPWAGQGRDSRGDRRATEAAGVPIHCGRGKQPILWLSRHRRAVSTRTIQSYVHNLARSLSGLGRLNYEWSDACIFVAPHPLLTVGQRRPAVHMHVLTAVFRVCARGLWLCGVGVARSNARVPVQLCTQVAADTAVDAAQ